MLLKVAAGIAVIIGIVLVLAARRPSTFQLERKIAINAPAEAIFGQVNNFHSWEAWSPWAKMDPNSKTSYAGPASGVGAIFSWDGNNQVGAGRMTITDSKPSSQILIQLDFIKPFAGTNLTTFTFTPEGKQTAVSWGMSGKVSFIPKVIGLFIDCDKMVATQFDKGLASLKEIAESPKK